MLLALGRQAVRTTLAKSVGTVTVNSVRNSGGVWTYRRVHPLDSKTCIWQVGSDTSGILSGRRYFSALAEGFTWVRRNCFTCLPLLPYIPRRLDLVKGENEGQYEGNDEDEYSS